MSAVQAEWLALLTPKIFRHLSSQDIPQICRREAVTKSRNQESKPVMTRIILQRLGFVFWCALALLAASGSGLAQTTTFTYQGSLTIGGTLANGGYDLQFKLYDQLTAGALQGSPNTVTVSNVTVTNGVFTVELNFGASGFSGAARYL